MIIAANHSSYLFNCGEGTQRLAHEHKTKLTRLEHIFITQSNWSRIGGLPGLSLTIQDAGVPNITLHGPPKMDGFFEAMRNFVILKQLKVGTAKCCAGEFYEDAVLCVDYVPLVKGHCDREPILAFVCKCKPRPGTLSLEKCLQRGVPKGPLLGRLKNGESVTLDNGVTVEPEDVCEPDDPGPIFIVLDIPSLEYMKCLEEAEAVKKLHGNDVPIDDRPSLILHFSPVAVVRSREYQDFTAKFPSTKHLLLNEQNQFVFLLLLVPLHSITKADGISLQIFRIRRGTSDSMAVEPDRRSDFPHSQVFTSRMCPTRVRF